MSELRDFVPDGHHLPTIKPHSQEKLKVHNYYAEIFAAGMRKQWPNVVYLGLYSGAGAAEIERVGRVVMTSALSVLTQPVPFTHYVFVDEEARCIEALGHRVDSLGLSERVRLVHANVNSCSEQVLDAMPDFRKEGGVLTFCFIDPFRIDLDFNVIRRLSRLRIDILLMVPLGYDVRRNWRDYLDKPGWRDRLSTFLGESEWIEEWHRSGRPYSEFPRFVQGRLLGAMTALKFIEVENRDILDVKVAGKGVYLYSLHLFSKHRVAIKFWRDALRGAKDQHLLDL